MTRTAGRARTMQPMLALLGAAALTLGALLATRPHLSGPPRSWAGDDLAFACLWWGAALASAWLAVAALGCVAALARGHAGTAHHVRALGAAARAPSAPGRARQHVGLGAGRRARRACRFGADHRARGRRRQAHDPGRHAIAARRSDRANARHARSRPRPPRTPRRRPRSDRIVPLLLLLLLLLLRSPASRRARPRVPRPVRSSPRAPAPTSCDPATICGGSRVAEVARSTGEAQPADTRIVPYWRRVIATNRATLRSGDPSLIFPGELVTLPTLPD